MPKTILVIDDEKDMRVYLSTLFRQAGYEVVTADNGEEGLRLARETPPDLITLDVLMPRKSGVRAYQELRHAPETRDVPIVILTGLAQQQDLFGEELGSLPRPDAICDKPIDREVFLGRVKGLLGDAVSTDSS
ncbi:MAG: response regulator [Candidatus Eiseniibacteriota bacterium]|jgi:two-component system alkaline phosphatase synthesis response regulator PhoP